MEGRNLKVQFAGKLQQMQGCLQSAAHILKRLTSLSGFGKSSRPCNRRLLRGPSDVCQVAGCHGQITSRAAMRLLLGRVTTRDLQVTGCAAASPVQLYKTCRCGLWPRCFASNCKHFVAIPSTSGSETGQCLCVRTSAWDNMQPCLLVWCAHHLTMHSPVWSDL